MAAKDELNDVLRTVVGPALRADGFKGSGRRWQLIAENGDRAVVGLQASQFSSRDDVSCIINLAVIPEPWLAWNAVRRQSATPKNPNETWGLWRTRLAARIGEQFRDGRWQPWWVITNAADARVAAADMIDQLAVAVPRMRSLFDRDAMLFAIEAGGTDIYASQQTAVAVLLADQGPSSELEAAVAALRANHAELRQRYADALIPWLEQRAILTAER